ncbi:lactate/malate dehydrogenase [Absidia repens]|uniref:malate dehydrogenase n=1 Tax=Absidia repens TaxID=90262 RepID=A0A1X2IYP5_9FUNG|nr:lactate/malate dehydrogenase [Absidia repens]
MLDVTICGASAGNGQPLSLLLKQTDLITHLSLYDIVNTPGVAAEFKSFQHQLSFLLVFQEYLICLLMTSSKINAGIVRVLAMAAAKFASKAFMCIISNPVNSTVPIVTEVFKQLNVYDSERIFGATTLDIIRASTFVSELAGAEASALRVPVVGGHSSVTILSLLSQVAGTDKLTKEQVENAKDGAGSATLSMAFAGARFALNILEASVNGTPNVVECSYVHLVADQQGAHDVKSIVGNQIEYFSVPVELGVNGGELFAAVVPELNSNISKVSAFITEEAKL